VEVANAFTIISNLTHECDTLGHYDFRKSSEHKPVDTLVVAYSRVQPQSEVTTVQSYLLLECIFALRLTYDDS